MSISYYRWSLNGGSQLIRHQAIHVTLPGSTGRSHGWIRSHRSDEGKIVWKDHDAHVIATENTTITDPLDGSRTIHSIGINTPIQLRIPTFIPLHRGVYLLCTSSDDTGIEMAFVDVTNIQLATFGWLMNQLQIQPDEDERFILYSIRTGENSEKRIISPSALLLSESPSDGSLSLQPLLPEQRRCATRSSSWRRRWCQWTHHEMQQKREIIIPTRELPTEMKYMTLAFSHHNHLLPTPIMTQILSYLPLTERSLAVAQVNRTWNALAHNPALWTTRDIRELDCRAAKYVDLNSQPIVISNDRRSLQLIPKMILIEQNP